VTGAWLDETQPATNTVSPRMEQKWLDLVLAAPAHASVAYMHLIRNWKPVNIRTEAVAEKHTTNHEDTVSA
jgi:hypothetical protein